jgi:hypothetical protein
MQQIHTGWKAVKRKEYIAHDLETTPLEIRTNSRIWSNERLFVQFIDADTDRAGGIDIRFDSKLRYRIHNCNKFSPRLTDFPYYLPPTSEKVWRLTLDRTSGIRLKIHCNGMEVANVLLSDSECTGKTDWRDFWSRKVTKLYVSEKDSASDYYRPYTGTGE